MVVIYALECLENGKAYVGSTKANLAKRLREHRCLLRSGSHKCAGLLADWQQHGEPRFRIVELEKWDDLTLPARRESELRWMEVYAEKGLLYNEHLISMRPTDEAIRRGVANAHNKPGNRWTAEANEKRRQAQLGIPKGHGAKISATKRARRQGMR